VLVADDNPLWGEDDVHLRVLSADLQQVSTLTNIGELNEPQGLLLLPDGRLLVGDEGCIRVLKGFPAAVLSTKPSHKPPKKSKQQLLKEKKKRALAGGANSSGLVPKRSRSGASNSSSSSSSSSAAAIASNTTQIIEK
jgi:hypothetical protein